MKVSVAVSALFFHALTAFAKPGCGTREEIDIQQQLAPLLSEDSVVSFSFSPEWYGLTERASTPRVAPGYIAVVEVATEKDVQVTVSKLNCILLLRLMRAALDRSRSRIC